MPIQALMRIRNPVQNGSISARSNGPRQRSGGACDGERHGIADQHTKHGRDGRCSQTEPERGTVELIGGRHGQIADVGGETGREAPNPPAVPER